MLKNPSLFAKRLNIKERQTEQRSVVLLSAIMFVFGFISAGFSFRFQWLLFPNEVSYIASAVFLLAYILFLEVMRENVYLSRIVEVQANQKVIDTGLYAFVRHPMYSATFLLFISMPLILGSVISLLIFLIYPFIIAKRIENEEKVLEHELDGYPEYKMKVQYKVIPFIW